METASYLDQSHHHPNKCSLAGVVVLVVVVVMVYPTSAQTWLRQRKVSALDQVAQTNRPEVVQPVQKLVLRQAHAHL